MAKSKYEKLGLDYRLKETSPMDKKRCMELQKLLLSKEDILLNNLVDDSKMSNGKAKKEKSKNTCNIKSTTKYC